MAEDLQRLENERRTAAAATAHELRTPVTIVSARLHAARDGLLQLDDHEIAVLIAQLDGLVRIIEDLRILSLATAGRLTLRPEPLALDEVISALVAALAPTAADSHVRLVFNPGSTVTLEADRDRLAQVITNLTMNAIRHSPPHGEVRIGCALRAGAPAGRTLAEISISDSGPGFPAEVGDPFEPFISGRPTGDRPQGSGLGLTIVKAIVEAHGGTVRTSNHPPGATVVVTIPADPQGGETEVACRELAERIIGRTAGT
jgi:signal transduction histidine kinase